MNRKLMGLGFLAITALGAAAVAPASAFVSAEVNLLKKTAGMADTNVTPAGETLTAGLSLLPGALSLNVTSSSTWNHYDSHATVYCTSPNGTFSVPAARLTKTGSTAGDIVVACPSGKAGRGIGSIDDL